MAVVLFCFKHKGTDEVEGHRRGDPIVAMRNNHIWGSGEDKRAHLALHGNTDNWTDATVLIKITGMSVARATALMNRDTRAANISDIEYESPDAEDRVVQLARKMWRVRFAEMPPAWKSALNNIGYLEVTIDEIRPYFRHRRSEEVIA